MSTSGRFVDPTQPAATTEAIAAVASTALEQLLTLIDPRMQDVVRADHAAAIQNGAHLEPISGSIVLAGHRAAGKTRTVHFLGDLAQRDSVDLDTEIARVHGRSLREWVSADEAGFRKAERDVFADLRGPLVIAVGGGFLSLNPDLLKGHTVVEIPITFRSLRERLLSDPDRPRLRPALSLDEEIRVIYRSREIAHRAFCPKSLGWLIATLDRLAEVSHSPRDVVS